jgi:hypothetical protein
VEHLVKFQTAEGREGQHTAASLDDALRFVERLRNNEGAADVRVFRMHEVPIEFKTYFKVELRSGDDAATEAPAEGADVPEAPRPAMVGGPVAAASDGEGDAGGRRLFSRG